MKSSKKKSKKNSNLNLLNPASLNSPQFSRVKKMNRILNEYDLRLPEDYPWQLLGAVQIDLKPYLLPEDDLLITNVIRSRSVELLHQLGKAWGPQCINPAETDIDINVFRYRYQVASLLKKFLFKEGSDKQRVTSALLKFIKAEINCKNYNSRGYRELTEPDKIQTLAIFNHARQWIQEVIGNELPDDKELTLRSRHGPGASSNTSNGNTSKYFKYKEWPYDVTTRCREHAKTAISNDERWLGALEDAYRKQRKIPAHYILNRDAFWDSVLNTVPGNSIAFVPKSYETHRTIAIEPTMNLYMQLGVDGYIRKRLKRWLIDLDDQSRNQRLARDGSKQDAQDAFCTIDLSMASDSVALRLVRELLPEPWYHYLYDLRSPRGTVAVKGVIDRTFQYEKISSMGNGYTFALESLVFAALCHAVIRHRTGKYRPSLVAVYGDDIVIPQRYSAEVIDILRKAGFAINSEKSFVEGFFKESCGADWFKGEPVRPVYVKDYPTTIKELFNDRNRLVRTLSLRFNGADTVKKLFDKWIPLHLEIYGPCSDTEMDTYLHSENCLRGYWKDGAFRFWRYITKPSHYHGKETSKCFFFRKLMVDLSDKPWVSTPWDRLRNPDSAGSAFDVVRPRADHMALNNSAVDFWQSKYFERLPSTGR